MIEEEREIFEQEEMNVLEDVWMFYVGQRAITLSRLQSLLADAGFESEVKGLILSKHLSAFDQERGFRRYYQYINTSIGIVEVQTRFSEEGSVEEVLCGLLPKGMVWEDVQDAKIEPGSTF